MTNVSIALICGGPSPERGISLNSTRSVLDHLKGFNITLNVYYLGPDLHVYHLPERYMYSNTPQDFDYLFQPKDALSQESWIEVLKGFDLVFPLIHGAYGEDGELQSLLTAHGINYVGTTEKGCAAMFNKHLANHKLASLGYAVLDATLVNIDNIQMIAGSMLQVYKKVVVKPVAGGSSLGVHVVDSIDDAMKALYIIQDTYSCEVLMEAYCPGKEFTIVVLDTQKEPVALLPCEVELDQSSNIYCYRRKYLPTANTRLHCPPRFSEMQIDAIRASAKSLFKQFEMRDFVRMDGWLLPDGKVMFSDFNPISGLEQNSFVFIQASRVGLTHADVLAHIIDNALARSQKPSLIRNANTNEKQRVHVIMGGEGPERQVSLMSGTNVWLKLRQSSRFHPVPYFLDTQGQVWPADDMHLLNHTVEEVAYHLQQSHFSELVNEIRNALGHPSLNQPSKPMPLSLEAFCVLSKKAGAQVFNALHGGMGENGELQKQLDQYEIPYNGPDAEFSAVGIDKLKFGDAVNAQKIQGLYALPKCHLLKDKLTWDQAINALNAHCLIVKPVDAGCSHGVWVIESAMAYSALELDPNTTYLIEPYVAVDKLVLNGNQIKRVIKNNWLELTIVVCEQQGKYKAKYPSITVAKDQFLSLEEKFQGGTGVNLTPPPEDIIAVEHVQSIQDRLAKLASQLGMRQYARFDLFYNDRLDEIIIIEVNSLPALTPATVLFHQMLADSPSMTPLATLEHLCETSTYSDV